MIPNSNPKNMKQKIKQTLMVIVGLLLSTTAFSSDFEVNGIYYDITNSTNKTVAVTYRGVYSDSFTDEYTGAVTIPSSVTYSGTTYSVTSIGDTAFRYCSGLTSVTIPNSVTSIGGSAFSNCKGLTSVTIPNSVTSIGYEAFYNCTGLTSVTIPNSVTKIVSEAFYNCDGLTSITIPNSVTSIGYDAFYGTGWYNNQPNGILYLDNCCLGYKGDEPTGSLSLKEGTRLIGSKGFYNCDGLTSITIPNSVTSIGYDVFYGCSGLTSITIPNSVTSIGEYAFYGCSGLTSITIPNSVTSIGEDAFCNCYGLTYITIPNSVTSIGNSAFCNCYGLTSITIPNSVTSIGSGAFYYCYGLTEVNISDLSAWCKIDFGNSYANPLYYANKLKLNGAEIKDLVIPNDITKIKDYAFFECSGLTSVTIPNSVTEIGSSAFSYCSGLTTITIPNSVTSIGNSAFYGCSNLETVINLSNLIFSKGSSGYGYIAYYACRVINDPNVSMVEDFVFSKVDNVNILGAYLGNATELILPTDFNGENYIIGDYAFYECTGLTSITIPNSVTTIGNSAFSGCSGLTEVNISDLSAWCKIDFGNSYANPLSYAKKLKLNGAEIKDLVIPNDITEIKNSAFEGCTSLTSITLPNSITSISERAFSGCTGLTSVIIGDSVSSIGASAFYGCSNLIESNNVISPTSVTVNLNTLCSSNLVPCIAINNKYYTNSTLVESLDPVSDYNYDLGLKFKDNFILIGSSSFLTGELELTTQAAKATSSSSVRLIATTNCDATAGTGFEWRRYDAPAEMPSNKVSCPIVDGMLVGTLRGLRDDAYYKYRPFYTSASGNSYYGEWVAFFTGDANVYFEPEVQTYSDYAITDNSVVVKGYVLEGTDEITAQGFEYWKTGSTILPSSTENRMTVMASGIKMSATLANLEYNSTYKYRAFVTTAKGTTYGDEVEFETGNDPVGVESIIIDKSATEVFEIARYDIHGRLLSKPSRGINIIIYSDGTTRKEIIK